MAFMAVQCFHCSMMQVKQQSKSSNKWVCVVCNHRQSLRKIHALSPSAPDVRGFVQSFNLRFQSQSQSISEQTDQVLESSSKKRRMDWSQYLDPPNLDHDKEDGGSIGDELFVTELMTSQKTVSKGKSGCSLNRKPADSIRAKDRDGKFEDRGELGNVDRAKTSSKWSSYIEDSEIAGDEGFRRSAGSELEGFGGLGGGSVKIFEEVHPDFL